MKLDEVFKRIKNPVPVGTKVRIREDLQPRKVYGCESFENSMCRYRGMTTHITRVRGARPLDISMDCRYELAVDNGSWAWSRIMFEVVR